MQAPTVPARACSGAGTVGAQLLTLPKTPVSCSALAVTTGRSTEIGYVREASWSQVGSRVSVTTPELAVGTKFRAAGLSLATAAAAGPPPSRTIGRPTKNEGTGWVSQPWLPQNCCWLSTRMRPSCCYLNETCCAGSATSEKPSVLASAALCRTKRALNPEIVERKEMSARGEAASGE